MSTGFDPRSAEAVSAFVDGELSAEEARAVTAAMQADRELARRVEFHRRAASLLHTLHDPVLEEPVPGRLLYAQARRPAPAALAAGAAALLLAGFVAGWVARGTPLADTGLVQSVALPGMAAHRVFLPEVRHPVEVPASEQAHLAAWLGKRLGARVVVPDLRSTEYFLVGGRLLHAADQPAAQIMYEDDHGERMTLYIRRNPGPEPSTAMRFESVGEFGAYYWSDEALAFAMVGPADEREELQAISMLIYEQFSTPAAVKAES